MCGLYQQPDVRVRELLPPKPPAPAAQMKSRSRATNHQHIALGRSHANLIHHHKNYVPSAKACVPTRIRPRAALCVHARLPFPLKFPPWFQAPLAKPLRSGKSTTYVDPRRENVGEKPVAPRLRPHLPKSRPLCVSGDLCGEFSLRNVTAQKPCVKACKSGYMRVLDSTTRFRILTHFTVYQAALPLFTLDFRTRLNNSLTPLLNSASFQRLNATPLLQAATNANGLRTLRLTIIDTH